MVYPTYQSANSIWVSGSPLKMIPLEIPLEKMKKSNVWDITIQ